MSEREIQKTISKIIFSSFSPNLISGGSKLNKLQQIYRQNSLTFKQQISQSGRMLTKKIFGTAIRCVNKNKQQEQFVNSKNLVSLSFIFLNIIFLDEYALKLVIEELNNSEELAIKMMQSYNPYEEIGISGGDLHKILAEIILKINSLRSIFSIADILKDYYVASQTFSYFLRLILTKLKYKDADNLGAGLEKTCEMYSILCEYFDLNVIARSSPNIRKNNAAPGQANFGEKSQVYLFNNYNLFISTVDNEEFCCGRYYSNENQLFNSEKQIRKSTLQFILQCREAEQKQLKEQSEEEGDKVVMRLSQFQMDLGASSSTMMLGAKDGQTPYFSSNAPTPQFGSLLQSTRFRKSIDFQVNNQLQSIKNPESSPGPSSIKQTTFQLYVPSKQLKSSRSNLKNQQKNPFKKYQFLSTNTKFTPYSFEPGTSMKRRPTIQEDIEYHNKPRSPPSAEFKPNQEKLKQNFQRKQNEDIYLTKAIQPQYKKDLKSSKIQQKKQKIIPKQERDQIKPKNIMQFDDKHKINIPEFIQKSFEFNNAMYYQHLRLSSKSKQEKSVQSMNQFNARWQQNYVNVEHHITQKQKRNRKKDLSSRKYSINEGKSNSKNTLAHKQKNQIHQSNHFQKAEQQYEQMLKSRKTATDLNKKQLSINFENQNSRSADGQRNLQSKNPKKMEFTSNIMSFQISSTATKAQKKNEFEYKNFSPYKYQNRYENKTTKVPGLKIDKAKLAALRNSKSSKSSRSPRIQSNSEWNQRMGWSKHVSQYTPNTPSTPKGINEINYQNISVSPSSRLVKKYMEEETKYKLNEGKLTKTSKFPQFLRHTKSRKLMKSQKFIWRNQNDIKQQKKNISISQSYGKRNPDKQNQGNILSPQFYGRSKKNSVYVQLKAYTEGQQNISSHSLNKLKHNLSQPHLMIVPDAIYGLSNDFNHRPWLYGTKMCNDPSPIPIHKQITQLMLRKRQTFASSSPLRNQEGIHPPIFSSQYVNIQALHKNNYTHFVPQPTIQYANAPQGFAHQRTPIFNKQVNYLPPHYQNDLKRSWRTSGQAEALKQSSYSKFQQKQYRDVNFTTLNSTVLSKAESPSTQFSFENELLLRNPNIRKQIWEPTILTKL